MEKTLQTGSDSEPVWAYFIVPWHCSCRAYRRNPLSSWLVQRSQCFVIKGSLVLANSGCCCKMGQKTVVKCVEKYPIVFGKVKFKRIHYIYRRIKFLFPLSIDSQFFNNSLSAFQLLCASWPIIYILNQI